MIRAVGSIRLALVGMLLLAIGAALSYDNPVATPIWVLVVPLAFLAVNLLAAIVTNPRINRRGGLLVFHLGLLAIIVLAGIGRLTHLDAQLEITEGAAFSPSDLTKLQQGPWHSGALDRLTFVQGSFTVDYSPGMVRGLTHSQVLVPDDQTAVPGDPRGWQTKVVGDDRPLILEGYRFYTTFNKGFAPVLTWTPDGGGAALSGTIHMPPYPLFEYKQDSSWTPPNEKGRVDSNSKEIKFWLRLKTNLREDAAWVLDGKTATGVLVVNVDNQRVELEPGQSVRVPGGDLRYERLTTWMGYKVFYDPTLHWLFGAAIMAVLGLGTHFWRKAGARLQIAPAPLVPMPLMMDTTASSPDVSDGTATQGRTSVAGRSG